MPRARKQIDPYKTLDRLTHPDVIGESEYRAVYECLEESLSGWEDDGGLSPKEWLEAVLDQCHEAVSSLRQQLRQLPEHEPPEEPVVQSAELFTFQVTRSDGERELYQAATMEDAAAQHSMKWPRDTPSSIVKIRR